MTNGAILFVFGFLVTFFGWFATGYQLQGVDLGISLGLGASLVVALCMCKIEGLAR